MGRSRFGKYGAACGGCLTVETIGDTFTGPRAPNGVRVEDVIAIQKGTAIPIASSSSRAISTAASTT
jgi:hypothetical protein